MYMRLAFAVAAHLEPEILVVDEVLAVGDAKFQEKCLGKMSEVAKQGRTVLFVSHNMAAVQQLCTRVLWLVQGQNQGIERPTEAITHYLQSGSTESVWRADASSNLQNPYFSPTDFQLVTTDLKPMRGAITNDVGFGVLIAGECKQLHSSLTVGFAAYTIFNELLFWSVHTDTPEEQWPRIEVGHNTVVGWMPPHFLNEGDYRIDLIVSLHMTQWLAQPEINTASLHLSIRGGLSESPFWLAARPGKLAPILSFQRISPSTL